MTNLNKHIFSIFIWTTIIIITTGCHNSLDKILSDKKLVPVKIIYEEGDDGHLIFRLTIKQIGNRFSAREATTDNFTKPQKNTYLEIDSLTDEQINYLRKYLITSSMMQKKCENVTSLTQLTNITYSEGEISIQGDCDWKDIDYIELRKSLFKLEE